MNDEAIAGREVGPSAYALEQVRVVDDIIVAALASLLRQISCAPSPSREHLQDLVSARGTWLLVARELCSGAIVGTLTVFVYRIATGVRARIEDVVVDERQRGRGIGALLTTEAIALARAQNARAIDLTTRPHRQAANRLYRRLGFERRDTNVYRLDLTHSS